MQLSLWWVFIKTSASNNGELSIVKYHRNINNNMLHCCRFTFTLSPPSSSAVSSWRVMRPLQMMLVSLHYHDDDDDDNGHFITSQQWIYPRGYSRLKKRKGLTPRMMPQAVTQWGLKMGENQMCNLHLPSMSRNATMLIWFLHLLESPIQIFRQW